jgi:hypothetical protein
MHPRTAPVVGLKGPLALGHGCHSLLRLATTSDAQAWTRSPLVSSSSRSLPARSPIESPDRSRAATYGRLFEGTDEISEGQTYDRRPVTGLIRHSCHRAGVARNLVPGNVSERLAEAQKTVNFWQCRSHSGAAADNEVRTSERSRAHRMRYACDEPRPAGALPVNDRAAATVPFHSLWITLWTVRLRSIVGLFDQP